MAEYSDIRTGRHCVFILHAHLVFVTKYRRKVFDGRHLTRMEEIMREVCADFGTELAEFNGEPDHVHLLVNFPPKVALSRLVNSLKGVSSRRMRQEFPDLHRRTVCGPPLTSQGPPTVPLFRCCASTSSSRTALPDTG